MKFLLSLLIFGVSFLLIGCQWPEEATGSGNSPKAELAPQEDARPNSDAVVVVRMRTVVLEFPSGMASSSEELWSYLEEEPVGAQRLATLGRNGFRVGLGRESSWTDVASVLTEMTGTVLVPTDHVSLPNAPQHITLKQKEFNETVFLFHEDRTVSGRDLPKGEYVLSVVCTVDQDDPTRLLVTGMPQVQVDTLKVHRKRNSVGLGRGYKYIGFNDLLFQIPLNKGEFVVVGPGIASRRPTSVGQQFLVYQKDGIDFETVIVLRPETVRVVRRPSMVPGTREMP